MKVVLQRTGKPLDLSLRIACYDTEDDLAFDINLLVKCDGRGSRCSVVGL